MADSFAANVNETFIKPVQDEVGKALEVGVSAVTGTQQDPQKVAEEAKKKQEAEQKRLLWARSTIDRYRKLEDEMQRIRMQKEQQEQQKQQIEAQEKQQQQSQVQQKKIEHSQAVKDAQTKAEVRKGVGG